MSFNIIKKYFLPHQKWRVEFTFGAYCLFVLGKTTQNRNTLLIDQFHYAKVSIIVLGEKLDTVNQPKTEK